LPALPSLSGSLEISCPNKCAAVYRGHVLALKHPPPTHLEGPSQRLFLPTRARATTDRARSFSISFSFAPHLPFLRSFRASLPPLVWFYHTPFRDRLYRVPSKIARNLCSPFVPLLGSGSAFFDEAAFSAPSFRDALPVPSFLLAAGFLGLRFPVYSLVPGTSHWVRLLGAGCDGCVAVFPVSAPSASFPFSRSIAPLLA